MKPDLLHYAALNVPRYTSYPTAPHFSGTVGGSDYAAWLEELGPSATLSLYLHVPFCRSICRYCGCHTRATRRDEPIAAYAATLKREIDLIARHAFSVGEIRHIHWGGGTPGILSERDFLGLCEAMARRFNITEDAERAIELDPRFVTPSLAAMLLQAGITRVNLGVQDFSPHVQIAIGRWQPFDMVEGACVTLREAGINRIGFDLMYGLPHQGVADVERTVEQAVGLAPDRIAAFGYAHVPWLKKHQRCIDEQALPGAETRLASADAIARCLEAAGYRRVGLDHYARPDDKLAIAAQAGSLRRNFQGYTDDPAEALIGLGASAIGRLPQGFVQNAPDIGGWQRAIESGRLGTVRGRRLSPEDRLRGEIIERLMCQFAVDLEDVCCRHEMPCMMLGGWRESLQPLSLDGLVRIEGHVVTVSAEAREFVRLVASAFDTYLVSNTQRHAQAV